MRRLVVRRLVAMAAVAALDRLCLDLERFLLERSVRNDRRPPAGDRVPTQLEHGRIVTDALMLSDHRHRVVRVGPDDGRAIELHGTDVGWTLKEIAAVDHSHDRRESAPTSIQRRAP